MKKRTSLPTTRDLAERLDLSHSTVARALRNDPRITEAVRQRVLKAAEKLGYKRDPKLAELMSHMRSTWRRGYQGALAWVSDQRLDIPFERSVHEVYWPHAAQRAQELGYTLEPFCGAECADAARLSRVFQARGVRGVVLVFYRGFHSEDWKWDWSRFAWAYFGVLPEGLNVDSVDADATTNLLTLFATLASKGYRRIGICTTHLYEQRLRYSLTSTRYRFGMQRAEHAMFEHCLLHDMSQTSARKVAAWIKKHHVDCAVSQMPGMDELLRSIGYPPPTRIGLAYQAVKSKSQNSGICQRDDLLARALIDTVVTDVETGRFGMRDDPKQTVVMGMWQQGTTCR